jgi:hypothetical protein
MELLMYEKEKTVCIFTLEKEHESLIPLIEDAFKKEGIAMQIRSKYDSAYDGLFIGQKGIGDLYVFDKDTKQAEQILQQILSSDTS